MPLLRCLQVMEHITSLGFGYSLSKSDHAARCTDGQHLTQMKERGFSREVMMLVKPSIRLQALVSLVHKLAGTLQSPSIISHAKSDASTRSYSCLPASFVFFESKPFSTNSVTRYIGSRNLPSAFRN
ncbi:unnamed protein product [Pylaiella littoralis]